MVHMTITIGSNRQKITIRGLLIILICSQYY